MKILKVFLAVALMCASWYGFIILAEQFMMIRFILLVHSFVWMIIAYERIMDCVDEKYRVNLLIKEEDDYDNRDER